MVSLSSAELLAGQHHSRLERLELCVVYQCDTEPGRVPVSGRPIDRIITCQRAEHAPTTQGRPQWREPEIIPSPEWVSTTPEGQKMNFSRPDLCRRCRGRSMV